MRAALLKTHFFQNMRNRIADRRCGRQRKVHNAERHAEPFCRFFGDKLTDAGDFKRSFLNRVRNVCNIAVRDFRQRRAHHAGTGNADIDDTVRLARTVERPRHKRVVFRRVAKDH